MYFYTLTHICTLLKYIDALTWTFDKKILSNSGFSIDPEKVEKLTGLTRYLYEDFLCSLLMSYWTSLCVLRRQSSLYETLFHCNTLSKRHHHHHEDFYAPL
jgi:hypothetical protein